MASFALSKKFKMLVYDHQRHQHIFKNRELKCVRCQLEKET